MNFTLRSFIYKIVVICFTMLSFHQALSENGGILLSKYLEHQALSDQSTSKSQLLKTGLSGQMILSFGFGNNIRGFSNPEYAVERNYNEYGLELITGFGMGIIAGIGGAAIGIVTERLTSPECNKLVCSNLGPSIGGLLLLPVGATYGVMLMGDRGYQKGSKSSTAVGALIGTLGTFGLTRLMNAGSSGFNVLGTLAAACLPPIGATIAYNMTATYHSRVQ